MTKIATNLTRTSTKVWICRSNGTSTRRATPPAIIVIPINFRTGDQSKIMQPALCCIVMYKLHGSSSRLSSVSGLYWRIDMSCGDAVYAGLHQMSIVKVSSYSSSSGHYVPPARNILMPSWSSPFFSRLGLSMSSTIWARGSFEVNGMHCADVSPTYILAWRNAKLSLIWLVHVDVSV